MPIKAQVRHSICTGKRTCLSNSGWI